MTERYKARSTGLNRPAVAIPDKVPDSTGTQRRLGWSMTVELCVPAPNNALDLFRLICLFCCSSIFLWLGWFHIHCFTSWSFTIHRSSNIGNNKITDTAAAGQKKWEKKRTKRKKQKKTELNKKEISSKHTNRQYNEQH